MLVKQKVRVLVVDDSIFFREMISKGIGSDSGIEVVGKAANPFEARDMIISLKPDVLTLDVEMPRMSGIEFLKRLMPQYPLPVVVVSSASNNVFEALNSGAVDFVKKPEAANFEGFLNELIIKIKIASTAKVGNMKNSSALHRDNAITGFSGKHKFIAIGASTGGTEAISFILKNFGKDMPGIVIVQHMPPVFTRMYAERLNNTCKLEVREAQDGDEVLPGKVLIAPGDFQMKMKKRGGRYFVECKKGEKVNGHCPAVDVLFHSVAECAGAETVGIILTGMGYDGAKGLLAIKNKGGYTIGQDEQTSVVYGMPKVAFDIGGVIKQMSLYDIPDLVYKEISK